MAPRARGPVQGCLAMHVRGGEARPQLDQQAAHIGITLECSLVQRGVTLLPARVGVGALLDHQADGGADLARVRRVACEEVQGGRSRRGGERGVGALAKQQLAPLYPLHIAGGVQRRPPVLVGRVQLLLCPLGLQRKGEHVVVLGFTQVCKPHARQIANHVFVIQVGRVSFLGLAAPGRLGTLALIADGGKAAKDARSKGQARGACLRIVQVFPCFRPARDDIHGAHAA
mmetsp:Transcript_29888/g.75202  ORF Transcript_29888/g.75202 Transcript_29888/m.75202 type:complete len:229 (-) Transcript_29888:124-810(-)